jgi:hypothetical protein
MPEPLHYETPRLQWSALQVLLTVFTVIEVPFVIYCIFNSIL